MRIAAFLLFAVLTGGCGKTTPATPKNPDTGSGASDKDRLQGVWEIESFEAGDADDPMPEDERKATRFIFQGDRFRIAANTPSREGFSFVTDTASNPSVLILTMLDESGEPSRVRTTKNDPGRVQKWEWIYKFDGDILVVAFGKGSDPRPTEFKPKPSVNKTTPGKYIAAISVAKLKKTDEPPPKDPPRSPTSGRSTTRK